MELELDLVLALELDREVEVHWHRVSRERSLVKKEALPHPIISGAIQSELMIRVARSALQPRH